MKAMPNHSVLFRNRRSGKFESISRPWTPETWDEGWLDSRGRFRVYRPDCPRAYASGHCLRAHVVWWLAHGLGHPDGTELHHKNENRLDDRLDNLEPLTNSEHRLRHTRANGERLTLSCAACGSQFERRRSRIRYDRPFCSFWCYRAAPVAEATKRKQSEALKRAYAEGRR